MHTNSNEHRPNCSSSQSDPRRFLGSWIAHAVRDPNGRTYNRTAHLDARRNMMQQWADYLDKIKTGAEVTTATRKSRITKTVSATSTKGSCFEPCSRQNSIRFISIGPFMESINTVILINNLVPISISREIRRWIPPNAPFGGFVMTRRPGGLVGHAAHER